MPIQLVHMELPLTSDPNIFIRHTRSVMDTLLGDETGWRLWITLNR